MVALLAHLVLLFGLALQGEHFAGDVDLDIVGFEARQ